MHNVVTDLLLLVLNIFRDRKMIKSFLSNWYVITVIDSPIIQADSRYLDVVNYYERD